MAKFASLEGATVTIRNWDKFNPRKDRARSIWLRLDHSIFDEKDFFDFTAGELLFWFYLLCQASKKSGDSVEISVNHVTVIGRVTEFDAQKALIKLSQRGIVSVTTPEKKRKSSKVWLPSQTITEPAQKVMGPTYERTNVTNERTNEAAVAEEFDLESLYAKYPRKMGKGPGMKKLTREIKTRADFDELSGALDRFLAHHRKAATEAQFIPHFSTFVSNWRDWLDKSAGHSIAPIASKPSAPPVVQRIEPEHTSPPSDLLETHGALFRKFGIPAKETA